MVRDVTIKITVSSEMPEELQSYGLEEYSPSAFFAALVATAAVPASCFISAFK